MFEQTPQEHALFPWRTTRI